ECAQAASDIFPTLIMALITLVPQILTDLQRSTAAGDLHCMKSFGIFFGLVGLVTTLGALSQFYSACYANFETLSSTTWEYKSLGPAFYLLLVATLLKIFDIAAHLLVPVPKAGYWSPDPRFEEELEDGLELLPTA
ncbi:hypothetical protein B484DRAFT_433636, partial [Ochromonadaceae sp. CCMP2298]